MKHWDLALVPKTKKDTALNWTIAENDLDIWGACMERVKQCQFCNFLQINVRTGWVRFRPCLSRNRLHVFCNLQQLMFLRELLLHSGEPVSF